MLDLKKTLRAVITLMLFSLAFMPIVALAQAEEQASIMESGLSVKWIEPKGNYRSIDTNYRFVSDALDCEVKWDDDIRRVSISK